MGLGLARAPRIRQRMAGCAAGRGASRLQPPAFGERNHLPVTDDEVVDEAHVNEREGLGEALGDDPVGGAGLGDPAGMLVERDERGGVVHHRPPHDDPGMRGSAVDGPLKDVLGEDRLVAVVEVDDAEDLVAQPAKPGLDVAPGAGRRGERAVAPQPGFHPAGVKLVQGMHAGAVHGGEKEGAEPVVRIVEEFAQAPRGGECREIEVDADKAEQLVVIEGCGARALDTGEQGFEGGLRRVSGVGRIWCGGLGADGGGVSVGMRGASSAASGRGAGALSPRRPTTPSRPLRSTSPTAIVIRASRQ